MLERMPGSKIAYDFYAEKVPWIGAGVVAYKPWVEKNPSATISVLIALNKALNFIHTSPRAAESSVAKFVGAQSPAEADMQFKYLAARTPATLGAVNVRTLQSIYAAVRYASNGIGPSDAFARSAVDNSYLEKALAASR
jgi:ABC-type nitrate/sulfonate/bicarbonate transport system substrate-binding protein